MPIVLGVLATPAEEVQRTGLDWATNKSGISSESEASYFWLPDGCIDPYPLTVIWDSWYKQHNGYYIPWIIGGTTSFPWNSTYAGEKVYITYDPYPDSAPDGNTHKFAVSSFTKDITTNGQFSGGAAATVVGSQVVEYGRWYRHALICKRVGDSIRIRAYQDLPSLAKYHDIDASNWAPTYNAFYTPNRVVFGDAPWNASKERAAQYMRNIQFYQTADFWDDTTSLLAEAANDTVNTPVTATGIASAIYANRNPTPSDVTDKSGNGNHPTWVNANRPALWEEA